MKQLLFVLFCLAQLIGKAQVFNITTYGAVGDSATMNTLAIQAAVDACSNAGGGVVKVPAGIFITATVFLKSNVTVQIDSGGKILGAPLTTDYVDVYPDIATSSSGYPQRSVFYAENQHNITIEGPGTFDGNGTSVSFLADAGNKPFGFRFISCTNLRYQNIFLHNSGFWMMHNLNCDSVTLKHVTIVNQAWGNNDGISFDGCRNVLVDSCYADCNDDPMVMKTTSPAACGNIEIEHCTFATYSRGIKIGTESSGPFYNIHVHDCKVEFSTHGPWGSTYAGKCGINLAVVDGGSMQNILIESVDISGVKAPICIRLGNRGTRYSDTVPPPGVGWMRDVEIKNVIITATTNLSSSITGIPGYSAKNIRLTNLDVTYPGGWPALDSDFVVPENVNARPEADLFGDTLPAAGLFARHIDSLTLNNVCFHAMQPDGRPDFYLYDVAHLDSAALCGNLIATAVDELKLKSTVKVYPNPAADGNFVISTGNAWLGAEVELLDMNGRTIAQDAIKSNRQTFSLGWVEMGIYLLQLHTGSRVVSKRLVICH